MRILIRVSAEKGVKMLSNNNKVCDLQGVNACMSILFYLILPNVEKTATPQKCSLTSLARLTMAT